MPRNRQPWGDEDPITVVAQIVILLIGVLVLVGVLYLVSTGAYS